MIIKEHWHNCANHEYGIFRALFIEWFDTSEDYLFANYVNEFATKYDLELSWDYSTGGIICDISEQQMLMFDIKYPFKEKYDYRS